MLYILIDCILFNSFEMMEILFEKKKGNQIIDDYII